MNYSLKEIRLLARFYECDFNWAKILRRDTPGQLKLTVKEAAVRMGSYFIFSEAKEWPTDNTRYMDKMAALRQDIYALGRGLGPNQLGSLFTMECFISHLFKAKPNVDELYGAKRQFLTYRTISRDVNVALLKSNRLWTFFWPTLQRPLDVFNWQRNVYFERQLAKLGEETANCEFKIRDAQKNIEHLELVLKDAQMGKEIYLAKRDAANAKLEEIRAEKAKKLKRSKF